MTIPYHKKYRQKSIDIYMRVFQAKEFDYHWLTRDQAQRYIYDTERHPRFKGFLYFYEDCLVGVCLGCLMDYFLSVNYEIHEIMIDPAYRHMGCGAAFLSELEAILSEQSVEYITLLTQTTLPAYHFYQRNQFLTSDTAVHMSKQIRN